MRFHVVALPHTQVTTQYANCAYTEKVRRFCIMMTDLGHEVFLYAGEEVEAPVTKLITCISEERRREAVGDKHYTQASFDTNDLHWQIFNGNVVRLLGGKNKRWVFEVKIQDGDIISEDVLTCQKLKAGGFDIWIDTTKTCNHVGKLKFQGNFSNFAKRIVALNSGTDSD